MNKPLVAACLVRFGVSPTAVTPDLMDQLVNAMAEGSATYTSYTALITQSGTDEPIADILGPNGIGEIIWTREAAGRYTGTLAGAFPALRTFLQITPTDALWYAILRASDDTIQIVINNSDGDGEDDDLNNTPIEIRVYPAS